MEFFGLSLSEMLVIVVIAILVFGQRLPQVAGEAAAVANKLRKQLADLRRDSGIDQEIYRARREFEESVRKPVQQLDVPGTVQRETQAVKAVLADAAQLEPRKDLETPATPAASANATPEPIKPPDAAAPPDPGRD